MNARTNLVVAAALFASLTGCVRVEMPSHMVSDAVDAGKDLFHSVKRAVTQDVNLDEVESNSAGSEFRLAKSGTADMPVAELKRACLDTLVAETRLRVGSDALEYRVTEQRVESKEDVGVYAICEIAVMRPRTLASTTPADPKAL
ncbi:MAG: hypothetical protein JNK82_28915 [Myxococcaceae bacterium]|nr:hypothetical protein [Myxococcaceae bacterium]